jgi:diaminopimelate epimerase
MMGGEFCCNAARSLGLFLCSEAGLREPCRLFLRVSGADAPVAVTADPARGTASAALPLPLAETVLDAEGRSLPVVALPGIVHVLAPDTPPDERVFARVRGAFEKAFPQREALGLLFCSEKTRSLTPLVYVYGSASLTAESSCGSGAAAFACFLQKNDGEGRFSITQPGGHLDVEVRREAGAVTGLTVSGPVRLLGVVEQRF